MFQSLRVGTPLYVLHKSEPRVERGEVTFVSNPVPQFGQTYTSGLMSQQPPTVDVKIKSGEQIIELKQLPANMSVADYGNGLVVSESREAILNEIGLLKSNSQRIIDSTDQHRAIVSKCDALLEELNPQIRQEAERSREIGSLSNRVGDLESSIKELKEMLALSLNSKSKEK